MVMSTSNEIEEEEEVENEFEENEITAGKL
jgi:hypothetical protein